MTDSGGPVGAPPFMELEGAYKELLEGLWYAHHVFKTRGDDGREGAALGCQAVVRFIAAARQSRWEWSVKQDERISPGL